MKSFLVIGMGLFGERLARKLVDLKNDVMIVDDNEEIVNGLVDVFTDAQIGDCTNPRVLQEIGVEDFDICFVAMGENFQSSLEITSLLKEYGAKYVISRADSEIQKKFLLKNGADEVTYPIKEVAERLAVRCSAKNVFDYIELSPDVSISETPIDDSWVGRSIAQVDVRKKHKVNILAIKRNDEVSLLPMADYVFKPNDHMMLVGKQEDIFKLSSRID